MTDKPVKIDGNKIYFESPFPSTKLPTCIGIGKEVLAFGEMVEGGGERFIHFKKSQWNNIKQFIDDKLLDEQKK